MLVVKRNGDVDDDDDYDVAREIVCMRADIMFMPTKSDDSVETCS